MPQILYISLLLRFTPIVWKCSDWVLFAELSVRSLQAVKQNAEFVEGWWKWRSYFIAFVDQVHKILKQRKWPFVVSNAVSRLSISLLTSVQWAQRVADEKEDITGLKPKVDANYVG